MAPMNQPNMSSTSPANDAAAMQVEPKIPVLDGSRTRLRHLRPADYPVLYELAFTGDTAWRWRYRGDSLRYEDFVSSLWQNVTAQYVIEEKATGALAGMISVYSYRPRDQHAHLSLLLAPAARGAAWPFEAVAIFINYVFTVWPLRKLYLESLEFNYETLQSGKGIWFEEEGRLRSHEYLDGRWWDLHLMAIWRDPFLARSQALLRAFS